MWYTNLVWIKSYSEITERRFYIIEMSQTCLRHMQKKSSHFGFLAVTFDRNKMFTLNLERICRLTSHMCTRTYTLIVFTQLGIGHFLLKPLF